VNDELNAVLGGAEQYFRDAPSQADAVTLPVDEAGPEGGDHPIGDGSLKRPCVG
jgi:hypothetical protein